MAEGNDERTELPTDRRRMETREQGSIARSTDLHAAILSAAATGALSFVGGDFTQSLSRLLRRSLAADAWVRVDQDRVVSLAWETAGAVAGGFVSFVAILVLAAIASGALQAGFRITPSALQPQWSRLNPIAGFQRLFSLRGVVKVAGSLLKVVIIGAVVAAYLTSELPKLLAAGSLELGSLATLTGDSLVALSFQLSLVLVILAILDYGYQFWQFEQTLKMTKQELRDELRMMEGDPQLRQRRKELHRKLTDSRQVQRAKEATVMITNPTEIAVALKYEPDRMDAPIVVAKGQGLLAARLRQVAAENGIPIVEKKPLARALFQVKVGQPIPLELYAAVAEIVAYVLRLRPKRRGA